jgi:hypothetical protein
MQTNPRGWSAMITDDIADISSSGTPEHSNAEHAVTSSSTKCEFEYQDLRMGNSPDY